MVEASYGIAAQQAILRQNVTLSVIKQSFDQEKAVANIIEQSAQTVEALNSRGRNVNFTV
jgi:hypothetical protein